MANPVAGATGAPRAAQVQHAQNVPKIAKQSANTRSNAPQDTVTISAQARAAQQAHQSTGDADHDGDSK
ncbi:MAG TPA: hypothetical protein VJS43_01375 [Candidatus Acidoferrales bacterium]|nr:hypothetical protein [Candidatus Acidoferrales bacterium]